MPYLIEKKKFLVIILTLTLEFLYHLQRIFSLFWLHLSATRVLTMLLGIVAKPSRRDKFEVTHESVAYLTGLLITIKKLVEKN